MSKTFLLTWNPHKFHWSDYEYICEYCRDCGPIYLNWSTCSRRMQPSDRFFLLMQGMGEKNGIIGSGQFVSDTEEMMFEPTGGRSWYVDIRLDILLDHSTEEILPTEMLKYLFPLQCWSPMSSGIMVRQEYVSELERVWNNIKDKKENDK